MVSKVGSEVDFEDEPKSRSLVNFGVLTICQNRLFWGQKHRRPQMASEAKTEANGWIEVAGHFLGIDQTSGNNSFTLKS